MRGQGRIFQRNNVYWIAYYLHGREFRESAKTDDPKEAEKFRKRRIKEVGADQIGAKPFIEPKLQRATIGELLDALIRDLTIRGKYSPNVKSNLKHLRDHFGLARAGDVNADHIGRYIEKLLAEGYRPASVNRHTQLLQQAYKLAIRERRLAEMPYFRRLSERDNARQGFLTEPQVKLLASALPEHLNDAVLFAFYSAWRRGEVFSLRWDDLMGDEIHLRPENSKNGEGRTLILAGELVNIIERRRKKARGALIFHNGDEKGNPVADFRKAWASGCVATGLGVFVCPKCTGTDTAHTCKTCKVEGKYSGRIFHDLRRSGVRNMLNAGVSEHTAMSVSGHRTSSMLRRYAIVAQGDLRSAMERTQEYLKRVATEEAASVSLRVQ